MEDTIEKIKSSVEQYWQIQIQPSLQDFVRIDNISRNFWQGNQWETQGKEKMLQASKFLIDWVQNQKLEGIKMQLLNDQNKTPMIFAEIEGSSKNSQTVLFYGHLDQQPPFTGWREGLGPFTPVIQDGKLYGRGAADDGYAIYGSIAAIKICQVLKLPHPRCIITIEADEQSESRDYGYYFDKLKDRIGNPSIVFCLDSGAANTEQLWMTTSLRGGVEGRLKVKVLKEGVHSGDASGVVPDTFRIVRNLLQRVEDSQTGRVIDDFHVQIPQERKIQVSDVVKAIGSDKVLKKFPFDGSTEPVTNDAVEGLLNRTWRPMMAIVGADGLPATEIAGNVVRPETCVKISIRLPPTADHENAAKVLQNTLEQNPPYNATVQLDHVDSWAGWNAPQNQPQLDDSLVKSSLAFYGQPALGIGEGGSIPLIDMLGKMFPQTQFVVTGVLVPGSNAHGPNQFLDIQFTKKLICCMTKVLADSFNFLKD